MLLGFKVVTFVQNIFSKLFYALLLHQKGHLNLIDLIKFL